MQGNEVAILEVVAELGEYGKGEGQLKGFSDHHGFIDTPPTLSMTGMCYRILLRCTTATHLCNIRLLRTDETHYCYGLLDTPPILSMTGMSSSILLRCTTAAPYGNILPQHTTATYYCNILT